MLLLISPRCCKTGGETFQKPLKPTSKSPLQSLNLSLGWESGTNFLWWHLGGWNPPGSDNFTSFEVCCGFPIPQMNTWWNCALSSLMIPYLHLTRLQHWFCPWQRSGVLLTCRHSMHDHPGTHPLPLFCPIFRSASSLGLLHPNSSYFNSWFRETIKIAKTMN